MTPERERQIDEESAWLYERRAAFVFYVDAFFEDVTRGLGYREGQALHSLGELRFVAVLPDGRHWAASADRDACDWVLRSTENRLYPGAGSGADPEVEKAYLLRPRWHIEKTAARELVERLRIPPPAT